MYQTLLEKLEVLQYLLTGCERFPNNANLPLLIYKQFFDNVSEDGTTLIADTFQTNGWANIWADGIYDYHHYHSTAHEALGVATGNAVVNFGGIGGIIIDLEPGDVVLIPAGVAHKCLKHSHDFKCVGAYPQGQQYDMNLGLPGERPQADENIKRVPMPATDPVFGDNGPVFKFWKG